LAFAAARMEIEYLRRRYARACDLICQNSAESMTAGTVIFRQIFTPDAEIIVSIDDEIVLRGSGPEEWARIVFEALCNTFEATQHLIGTQLVDILSLPGDDDGSGKAVMSSYLQAWHARANGVLDIFIGTYHDQVQFTKGLGWQISHMRLVRTSGEVREMDAGTASFLVS